MQHRFFKKTASQRWLKKILCCSQIFFADIKKCKNVFDDHYTFYIHFIQRRVLLLMASYGGEHYDPSSVHVAELNHDCTTVTKTSHADLQYTTIAEYVHCDQMRGNTCVFLGDSVAHSDPQDWSVYTYGEIFQTRMNYVDNERCTNEDNTVLSYILEGIESMTSTME